MRTKAAPIDRMTDSANQLVKEFADRVEWHDIYDEVGAPLYDALVRMDTQDEVRAVLGVVARSSGTVLDLAAGTGRFTLPFLALGRPVVALDLSPAMLDGLRSQLAAAPEPLRSRAEVVEADMSAFELRRRFSAIVLGATSITLLDEPQRRGLYESVLAHLEPGGNFVLTLMAQHSSAEPWQNTQHFEVDGRSYTISDHRTRGAEFREVTIIPQDTHLGTVKVCTSSVRVLDPKRVLDELRTAGFEVSEVHDLTSDGGDYGTLIVTARAAAHAN